MLLFVAIIWCFRTQHAPAAAPAPRALRKRILERLPRESYSREGTESESSECVICITVFEEGEEIRVLPCKHVFHITCVDTWFESHSSCPTCRHIVD